MRSRAFCFAPPGFVKKARTKGAANSTFHSAVRIFLPPAQILGSGWVKELQIAEISAIRMRVP